MPPQYNLCACGCGESFLIRPHRPPARYKRGHYDRVREDPAVRFSRYVFVTEWCHPWTGFRDRDGYGQFTIRHGFHVRAHRFAWEQAYGPIPPGLFACHTCDNPSCVRLLHLFLGDSAANMEDCKRKGWLTTQRYPALRGERAGRALLTEVQVLEIRDRYARGGITALALAREYDVTRSAVSALLHRRSWAHI